MGLFDFMSSEKRSLEVQSDLQKATSMRDLQDLISDSIGDEIDLSDKAIKSIPSVNACVDLISNIVASLDIELYENKDGKIREIADDKRLFLLNKESEEFLTAYQSRKLFVEDMLLYGSAFLHRKRVGIGEEELVYLDRSELSFLEQHGTKDFDVITSKGERIASYDLVYALRNSYKISKATSILDDNRELFKNMLYANEYKKNLTQNGGLQKVLVQPKKALGREFLSSLSQKIKSLYKGNDSVLVLNSDVNITPIATDKNVNIDTLSKGYDNDVQNVFGVPASILEGNASDEEYNNFIKTRILPLLRQLEQTYNRTLLTTEEKKTKYFKFNVDTLLRTSLKERYESYAIAIKNGVLTVNEVRELEGYEPIDGLEGILRLNLSDALLDVNNNRLVNINTNTIMNLENGQAQNINQ